MASSMAKSFGLITVGGLATFGLMQTVPQSNDNKKFWSKFSRSPSSSSLEDTCSETKTSTRTSTTTASRNDYSESIDASRRRLSVWKTMNTIPGYVIGVSVGGRSIWIEGDGYADLENSVPCTGDTVMRIASISKSITASLLAKLVQDKKIDLDCPIRRYLTSEQFPDKYWEGQKVDITLRQLVSHLAGIRHYKKVEETKSSESKTSKTNGNNNNNNGTEEFRKKEYFLKDHFPNVTESLSLFKDDPLVAKPGSKFVYTTFGWTLISAVMETQTEKKDFCKDLIRFLHNELGMVGTRLDENDPIILNRARYYCRETKTGKIVNVPYVDNSYKWAGGGLVSNVGDLLRFGNMMLYSFKGVDSAGRSGYLQQSVVNEMWTPAYNSKLDWDPNFGGYGIGWGVVREETAKRAFSAEPRFSTIISHTGGAVGASSVLLIEPRSELIVTIITNLQNAGGIYRIALDVAEEFISKHEEKNGRDASATNTTSDIKDITSTTKDNIKYNIAL